MIPVKNADGDWTVVVKIIADIISGAIGGFLPLLCVIILTVSAVMCLVALGKPKFIMDSPILKECFSCRPHLGRHPCAGRHLRVADLPRCGL